jgi:hypothetical protein
VIDLTGQSPLILFLIGAKPIGDTWLLGGYPGSDALAIKKLNQVDCLTKKSSFLLIEEGGALSLNVDYILSETGLARNEYSSVATWNTPIGAGGFPTNREIKLLRPSGNSILCN